MFVVQQDPQLDSCRMEFLRRVITSSMESIQQDTSEASNFNFQQAFSWMCKCQTMASIWKINTDELRIHQVCQLYQDGFDRLADEVRLLSMNTRWEFECKILPISKLSPINPLRRFCFATLFVSKWISWIRLLHCR